MRVKIVVKEHNKTIQSGFVFGPLDPKFTLRSQLLTEEGGWGGEVMLKPNTVCGMV